MTATVRIGTPWGESLVSVEVHDHDPYLTLAVGGHTVALTRGEARRVSDALYAASIAPAGELG